MYCFDISGLEGFLNEKSFVKENGRSCLVPVHQLIWPYTTYVFNLMQLQKFLERYRCYFIICIFFFAASWFIFHLLWKRQYDRILKPCSIKLHLCNLANFNRLQNFANGSPSNDTTKLKVNPLLWVILVRSNSSDSFINFDGLRNSFFLGCNYNMTITLFSQGSETYATLLPGLPFPNLWVHWAFQAPERYSALKETVSSYTFCENWLLEIDQN